MVMMFHDLGRPELSEVSLMIAHNLAAMQIITELNEGQESGNAFFQSRDECEKTILNWSAIKICGQKGMHLTSKKREFLRRNGVRKWQKGNLCTNCLRKCSRRFFANSHEVKARMPPPLSITLGRGA